MSRLRGRIVNWSGEDSVGIKVKLLDTHTQLPLAETLTDSIGVWEFEEPKRAGPLFIFVQGAILPLKEIRSN